MGIAALIAVGLAGCGSASGASKLQIAVFYYNASPYGIASYEAAIAEGNKLGAQVTAFDADNVAQTQADQMRDAITAGKYKAFWVFSLDPPSLAPLVKIAEAKGIKVATADYTFGPMTSQLKLSATPGLVTTVGQPLGAQETALVATIRAACAKQVGVGNPCNVAFMPGLENFPTDQLRIDYMRSAFASGPIHLLLTPAGEYDQPTAQQIALMYFGSRPKIDVFGSFGDQMTAGALTAFRQLGIVAGKDLQVFGIGGTAQLVADVRAGIVFATLGLYPATESTLGVKYLVAALHGRKVPNPVNVIGETHPVIIDAAFLEAHRGFRPDWSLTG